MYGLLLILYPACPRGLPYALQPLVQHGVHLRPHGGGPPGKGLRLQAEIIVLRVLDQQRAERRLPVDRGGQGVPGGGPALQVELLQHGLVVLQAGGAAADHLVGPAAVDGLVPVPVFPAGQVHHRVVEHRPGKDLQLLGAGQGQVGPGAVPRHKHPAAVEHEPFVPQHRPDGPDAVLDAAGERGLGGQAVVDVDHQPPGGLGQVLAGVFHHLHRAAHKAAPVDEEHTGPGGVLAALAAAGGHPVQHGGPDPHPGGKVAVAAAHVVPQIAHRLAQHGVGVAGGRRRAVGPVFHQRGLKPGVLRRGRVADCLVHRSGHAFLFAHDDGQHKGDDDGDDHAQGKTEHRSCRRRPPLPSRSCRR